MGIRIACKHFKLSFCDAAAHQPHDSLVTATSWPSQGCPSPKSLLGGRLSALPGEDDSGYFRRGSWSSLGEVVSWEARQNVAVSTRPGDSDSPGVLSRGLLSTGTGRERGKLLPQGCLPKTFHCPNHETS